MKFVILGHLMGKKDLENLSPIWRYLPVELFETATTLLPDRKTFRVASHFTVFDKAEGWIVGLTMTARQMMALPKEKARNRILEAVLFCQKELKAELLMLGALTSPLTSAGLWLTKNPKIKLNITTGNTYAAAAAIEQTEKAIKLASLNPNQIKIAVVGAAGVIGEAISRYFNQKNIYLILVEKTPERFDRLKPNLKGQDYFLTCDLEDLIKADIIITVTSHPAALINPKTLKENAIVVDVAEPSNLPQNTNLLRPDIIAIDGSRVNWSHIKAKTYCDLPPQVGFACMTEVILQALENRKENFVGSINMEHLTETQAWAKKWSFGLAEFTSFNKPLPLEKFNNLKQNHG